MAIDALGADRTIVQGICPCKVKLNRACYCGDILGVAEDNFDDLGPEDCARAGHAATSITYLPRFVAGEHGEADEWITAYPIAVVRGYTSATLGTKLYCADGATAIGTVATGLAATSLAAGTGGVCSNIIGMVVSATDSLLFPGVYSHEDDATST